MMGRLERGVCVEGVIEPEERHTHTQVQPREKGEKTRTKDEKEGKMTAGTK